MVPWQSLTIRPSFPYNALPSATQQLIKLILSCFRPNTIFVSVTLRMKILTTSLSYFPGLIIPRAESIIRLRYSHVLSSRITASVAGLQKIEMAYSGCKITTFRSPRSSSEAASASARARVGASTHRRQHQHHCKKGPITEAAHFLSYSGGYIGPLIRHYLRGKRGPRAL
jgi:hypothetical protein